MTKQKGSQRAAPIKSPGPIVNTQAAVGVQPPKLPDRPATPEAALDFMWQAFSNLNEWVRFSDAKAAAVLAADGVLIGAMATVVAGSRPGVIGSWPVLTGMCLVMLAAFYSAAYALASLLPQLRIPKRSPRQPKPKEAAVSAEESSSLVFFMDIDKTFPSAKTFHETVRQALADPERAVAEISYQVWANSKVAAVKYDRVTKAVWGLLVAAYLGALGAIALAIYFIWRSINGS